MAYFFFLPFIPSEVNLVQRPLDFTTYKKMVLIHLFISGKVKKKKQTIQTGGQFPLLTKSLLNITTLFPFAGTPLDVLFCPLQLQINKPIF